MRYRKIILVGLILSLGRISFVQAEDYSLQYFLSKASSKTIELSKKERGDLINQMERVLNRAQGVCAKLTRAIQAGEMNVRNQDKRFWISKLEQDELSIETGIQQINLLKQKSTRLVASIKLYRSLKDLSSNFTSYNNMASFSGFVGDLAPEMGLWADPVFYKLFLLPLAGSKDVEEKTTQKEKKPGSKRKKP